MSKCIECRKTLTVRHDKQGQITGWWCLNPGCILGRKNMKT